VAVPCSVTTSGWSEIEEAPGDAGQSSSPQPATQHPVAGRQKPFSVASNASTAAAAAAAAVEQPVISSSIAAHTPQTTSDVLQRSTGDINGFALVALQPCKQQQLQIPAPAAASACEAQRVAVQSSLPHYHKPSLSSSSVPLGKIFNNGSGCSGHHCQASSDGVLYQQLQLLPSSSSHGSCLEAEQQSCHQPLYASTAAATAAAAAAARMCCAFSRYQQRQFAVGVTEVSSQCRMHLSHPCSPVTSRHTQ